MSFHLTKLAMNADFADDPVAKNVMIALCWSFFDNAKHALMNQERICRRTSYKRRAVQLAIARLKRTPEKGASDAPFLCSEKIPLEDRAYGLINVDYFGVGAGNSPKYTINVSQLEAMQFPEQLTLKLTSLRAVESDQKGAPYAPLLENEPKAAKGAPDAPYVPEKGAPNEKKGASDALYTWNSHSSIYNNTHDNGKAPAPNGVGVCGEEGPSDKTRSRFTLRQWFAYAKAQPSITNPMAFAATRFQTTEHDGVLELHFELERQNKFAQQKASADCPACRGTGWEYITGKGVKPCGCRAVAQTK